MQYPFVELWPLLATVGVALVIVVAHRVVSVPWAAQLSPVALGAQFLVTAALWLALDSGSCPVDDGAAWLMLTAAFGVVALGGVAIGTAIVAARGAAGAARLLLAVPFGLALPYAAFLATLLTALCGD